MSDQNLNSPQVSKKRQEELIFLHNSAPICQTFGMTLQYNDAAQAVIYLPHNPRIDHGFGGIHGGILATLLDNAGWFTLGQYVQNWIATVEYRVSLLEPAKEVDLIAKGKIVKIGKSLSFAEMEVQTAQGKIIAVGSGVYTLTNVPLRMEDALPVLKKYEPLFKNF